MRAASAILVFTAFATVLNACSGQSSTSPQPGGTTPRGSQLAPRVPKPLKYSVFHSVDNICKTINLDVAEQVGFKRDQLKADYRQDESLSTVCDYLVGANGFSVGFQNTYSNGLSDVYARRAATAYWMPLSIQGYPAVFASKADGRKSGVCALHLGVTDQMGALVVYAGGVDPTGQVACAKARQLGDALVTVLKLQK